MRHLNRLALVVFLALVAPSAHATVFDLSEGAKVREQIFPDIFPNQTGPSCPRTFIPPALQDTALSNPHFYSSFSQALSVALDAPFDKLKPFQIYLRHKDASFQNHTGILFAYTVSGDVLREALKKARSGEHQIDWNKFARGEDLDNSLSSLIGRYLDIRSTNLSERQVLDKLLLGASQQTLQLATAQAVSPEVVNPEVIWRQVTFSFWDGIE